MQDYLEELIELIQQSYDEIALTIEEDEELDAEEL